MNDSPGYAVFFFEPALEALGDAIKPYLQDGPAGMHVPCREIDTGGAFVELTIQGRTNTGQDIELELMVPGAMIRMVVSARSDVEFGFYDRSRPSHVLVEPGMPTVTGDSGATVPPSQGTGSDPKPAPGATRPAA